MTEMGLLAERRCKPLKLQFHAMGSYNDRYTKKIRQVLNVNVEKRLVRAIEIRDNH